VFVGVCVCVCVLVCVFIGVCVCVFVEGVPWRRLPRSIQQRREQWLVRRDDTWDLARQRVAAMIPGTDMSTCACTCVYA
jgi:hypothetical protein